MPNSDTNGLYLDPTGLAVGHDGPASIFDVQGGSNDPVNFIIESIPSISPVIVCVFSSFVYVSSHKDKPFFLLK